MFLTNPLRYFSRRESRYHFPIINSPSFRSLSKTVASAAPTPEISSEVRKKGRLFFPLSCLAMETSSTCALVLSGKTEAENETAKLLKRNDTLKLPDDTEISVSLHSERDKSLEESGFQIDSDMNALSTDTEISVSLHTERDKSLEESGFQIDSYINAISTDTFGRFLIWCPRIPSTQDVISHNFSDLPLGAVCVADVQFKGRGRSKNLWESPPGCLMFSFTIQMEDGRIVPLLQYVISLAITEAVKDICDKKGLPYIDLKIKWPNDLYVNGLKVGGILCTSTYRSKKFDVTAGIGLNVDNDKPTTCLNEALTNLSSTPYKFRREDILAFFFNKFERLYDIFINQGFQALEELYYQTWLHSGQRVIVQEKKEDQVVENVVTIQGLTSSGYLLAIGDDNQMCELHPDGNSLDFFKGLIKSKLV